jgi:hypothetical protein
MNKFRKKSVGKALLLWAGRNQNTLIFAAIVTFMFMAAVTKRFGEVKIQKAGIEEVTKEEKGLFDVSHDDCLRHCHSKVKALPDIVIYRKLFLEKHPEVRKLLDSLLREENKLFSRAEMSKLEHPASFFDFSPEQYKLYSSRLFKCFTSRQRSDIKEIQRRFFGIEIDCICDYDKLEAAFSQKAGPGRFEDMLFEYFIEINEKIGFNRLVMSAANKIARSSPHLVFEAEFPSGPCFFMKDAHWFSIRLRSDLNFEDDLIKGLAAADYLKHRPQIRDKIVRREKILAKRREIEKRIEARILDFMKKESHDTNDMKKPSSEMPCKKLENLKQKRR